ncbi:MAG: hypothetical protein HYZ28_25735 [Myxococcales bacterium]|nr:hypothetical protein [Myxococcales bacterium]
MQTNAVSSSNAPVGRLPGWVLLLLVAALTHLTACPPTGPVCGQGQTACGKECFDLSSDKANCGACGVACGGGQVCQDSACRCSAGATLCSGSCVTTSTDPANCGACGTACLTDQLCQSGSCVCKTGTTLCAGKCVSTSTDPQNCGGCAGAGGTACATGQFCEAGQCKTTCTIPGNTVCGLSCVNTKTDSNHCGQCNQACPTAQICENSACKCPGTGTLCGQVCEDLSTSASNCGSCGRACDTAQSCHRGMCTYDVIAACFTNGQVVGLQAPSDFKGPSKALGTGPQSLGTVQDVLLAADGIDKRLYEARLGDLSQIPESVSTGASPNHILVDDPHIYLVNSMDNTLQVLKRGAVTPDAGTDAGALGIGLLAELNFGANTSPQAIAKIGNDLYIPLYGGWDTAASAGQKLLRVDVTNPAQPKVMDTIDLGTIDLKPFDGGSTVARPYSVVARGAKLYLALNNLNASTYAPEGPGMVAIVNSASKAVSAIDLGADACLNASWAVSTDAGILVSCGGKVTYDSNWKAVASEKTGVLLVSEAGARLSVWAPTCPPGGIDAGCEPPQLGRFAMVGNRLYVGDQTAGRVFVLELNGTSLAERRGYSDGGSPVLACPVGTMGFSSVNDLIAVP